MISFSELVHPDDRSALDEDAHANLTRLHFCLNSLRARYQKEMIVNRGFSTPAEQIAIYAKKGQAPKMKSWHLFGGAADIRDPHLELQHWCLENLEILEELGLYCEAFEHTPTWIHFQIYAPSSTKRFFEP